jgi:hypothetical protein
MEQVSLFPFAWTGHSLTFRGHVKGDYKWFTTTFLVFIRELIMQIAKPRCSQLINFTRLSSYLFLLRECSIIFTRNDDFYMEGGGLVYLALIEGNGSSCNEDKRINQ